MTEHTCLKPGHAWAECLCAEIDPADVPCIVCEGREYLESRCPACATLRAQDEPKRAATSPYSPDSPSPVAIPCAYADCESFTTTGVCANCAFQGRDKPKREPDVSVNRRAPGDGSEP